MSQILRIVIKKVILGIINIWSTDKNRRDSYVCGKIKLSLEKTNIGIDLKVLLFCVNDFIFETKMQ